MKLETFFEKFELLADAPCAVAKMRELIMWSAFCGSFSAEERNQPMPEEWVVKDAPTLPAIPSSWRWQRGSEVFDVIRGVSYKKSDARDIPVDGYFPVLRASNIGKGINFDGLVYVPEGNIRDEQFVRRGDILIAMSSGSKKLVGKAAPIETDFKGAFGAFCGIIRNKSTIADDVLARYFESPQYTSWVTAAGRGIGINNLGRGDLDSLPVPTPPLAEQKRIVAKVAELMALCDRLEAQQQEQEARHATLARASLARFADAPTPGNLEFLFHESYSITPADLRKSILGLAFQGDLAKGGARDRARGEAQRVLTDASAARYAYWSERHGAKRKYTEPEVFEAQDLPRLPEHWLWASIDSVCAQVTDGEHIQPPYQAEGVPMLSAKHVRDGYVTLEGAGLIAERAFQKSIERCQPENGDLLIVSVGATTGRSAIVANCPRFAIVRSVLLLKPVIMKEYLLWWLKNPWAFTWMTQASGASAQPHLYIRDLKRMPIPIAGLAEQCRIVAKVEQLMGLVNELEAHLDASRAGAASLLESVVCELTARG